MRGCSGKDSERRFGRLEGKVVEANVAIVPAAIGSMRSSSPPIALANLGRGNDGC